jgi:predicted GIY-YIG superfamily endonuclease
MPRFFYVYELVSQRDDTIRYRGITRDLKARIRKHNAGGCAHTSKYRPWYIEVAVAFRSENKARAFENYLKTGSGREFSRRHF